MDKTWFIFNIDHHTGPFSPEEVFRMFYDDKITSKSLMWKEGREGWDQFENIHEIYSIISDDDNLEEPIAVFELSEELCNSVELISEEDLFEENLSLEEEEEIEVELVQEVVEEIEPPSFIPREEEEVIVCIDPEVQAEQIIEETPVVLEEIEPVIELVEENVEVDQQIVVESETGNTKKIITAISIIALILITWFVIPGNKSSRIFHGLSKKDYRRLNDTIKMRRGVHFNVALQSQGKKIWLATNRQNDSVLYMTLTSVKNKILSRDSVVIFSKANLNNNIAKFDYFELYKGKKFVPGFYQMKLYGHEIGLIPKIKKYLKTTSTFGWMFKHYEGEFKYNKTVLLQKWVPSKFNKLLTSFRKKQRDRQLIPLTELRESYKTLIGLMDRTKAIFKEIILKTKKSKFFLDSFNRAYATGISPVYQGMMNHNKMIYDNISDIDSVKKGNYLAFLSIGKETGGIVADVVTESQKRGGMSSKFKMSLIRKINARFKKQQKLIITRVKMLSKEIKELD